jgi:hypothetical protein
MSIKSLKNNIHTLVHHWGMLRSAVLSHAGILPKTDAFIVSGFLGCFGLYYWHSLSYIEYGLPCVLQPWVNCLEYRSGRQRLSYAVFGRYQQRLILQRSGQRLFPVCPARMALARFLTMMRYWRIEIEAVICSLPALAWRFIQSRFDSD